MFDYLDNYYEYFGMIHFCKPNQQNAIMPIGKYHFTNFDNSTSYL